MTYSELNTWMDTQVNTKERTVIVISFSGSNITQDDQMQKRIEEHSNTTGSEVLTITSISE